MTKMHIHWHTGAAAPLLTLNGSLENPRLLHHLLHGARLASHEADTYSVQRLDVRRVLRSPVALFTAHTLLDLAKEAQEDACTLCLSGILRPLMNDLDDLQASDTCMLEPAHRAHTLMLDVPADNRLLFYARATLRTFLTQHCFTEERTEDTLLALGEGMTNAIHHGAHHQGSFQIQMKIDAGKLTAVITDAGTGFCLAAVPEPENLWDHGRGIWLMKKLMTVDYLSSVKGTVLTLTGEG